MDIGQACGCGQLGLRRQLRKGAAVPHPLWSSGSCCPARWRRANACSAIRRRPRPGLQASAAGQALSWRPVMAKSLSPVPRLPSRGRLQAGQRGRADGDCHYAGPAARPPDPLPFPPICAQAVWSWTVQGQPIGSGSNRSPAKPGLRTRSIRLEWPLNRGLSRPHLRHRRGSILSPERAGGAIAAASRDAGAVAGIRTARLLVHGHAAQSRAGQGGQNTSGS